MVSDKLYVRLVLIVLDISLSQIFSAYLQIIRSDSNECIFQSAALSASIRATVSGGVKPHLSISQADIREQFKVLNKCVPRHHQFLLQPHCLPEHAEVEAAAVALPVYYAGVSVMLYRSNELWRYVLWRLSGDDAWRKEHDCQ